MKKSLVLSIVMCLVLVASMTTATFAWYSANDSVTANINTITAASATGDLQIKFGGDPSYGYTASATMSGTLNPISPNVVYGSGSINSSTTFLSPNNWYTGKKTPTNTTLTQGAPSTNVITGTIELYNASNASTNSIALTVTPSFATAYGELSDLKYIFAEGSTIYARNNYSVVEGTTATLTNADQEELKATPATLNEVKPIGVMAGNSTKIITYYIWLDGFEATNTSMGAVFNMKLDFAAATTYVMTYDANTSKTISGVLPSPVAGTDGNKVTISNTVLTIPYVTASGVNGQQLIGWSNTEGTNSVDYELGAANVVLDGNKTVYAVWADVYTVRFNANKPESELIENVVNVPADQTKLVSEAANAINITNAIPGLRGYTFQGWAKTANGEVKFAAGATITLSDNVELFAIWQKMGE